MRLGRNGYQWTFANRTPSPDKEDQLEVYEGRDGTSPGPAEGADDGPLTSAALQLGPTKPKSVSTNNLGHDKVLPQLSEDEAMIDEFAGGNLAGHDPQASSDINANGHSSLNEEALPGVADHNPPDEDADSNGPIRQGPDRQQIRPKSSEVSIQGEYRSRSFAEDHQYTPTRIDSSIRQVSSPKDAAHSSSNRDPIKNPPLTEYIEKLESFSDSGEVNMQNEGESRTFAGRNQSTPTRRDSSIRQASSPSDGTYSSSNRDPVEKPPVTEDINRQASNSDSGEVDVQNEDVSRALTENHPSTPTRRDSSIRKASSLSDASNSSSNRDLINKPPNTEDIEIQESGSELGEVNMLNEDAFETFADGLQSTPISRDSSVRRDSPNDEKQNLFNKDSVSKSPITQRLNRQDPPSESSEDSMQNEDASQVLAEDHQTSPIRNDSSLEQGSLNPATSKSPYRDSDDLSMGEGLGRKELQAQTSDADMKNIEYSQNVLKVRQSIFVSRDSSISGDSLSTGATDKLPEQIIGDNSLPEKGNDGQEHYSATDKDTVEEEMAPQALLNDRLGSPAIEVSSAHRHGPLEDSKIQTSQKLKLSQPKRQASTSGSPESVISIDVTSQSLADSQVPIDFESENDSTSVRDSISDSSEAISAFSPMQSPYANQEDLSYRQSGLESEGEVIYTGSGDHTPPENNPDSQVIISSEDYDSSNITDEDIASTNPRFGLDGLPVSQIRFTRYNLPMSRHDPEDVPTLPENSIPPTETVADNMEKPKHEPFVTDEEANPGLLVIMKADNMSPDEEVGKGGEENENMRPMTLYEDHANNTFRESHPKGIEGEFPRVRNMNRFSADVFAAESGGDDEVDNETKIAVLHEPPSNHSQDENRDLERHISTWEEESKISPDDDHSPPAQDNESQVVQEVPIVDIIDLEGEDEDEDEEEDDIPSSSPQLKVDPSQSIVDTRKTDDINSEDGCVAKFESERFSSEGHLENDVGEAIDAGQVAHDAPMSLTSINDSHENVNSSTDQANKKLSNQDSPAIDASEHMKISRDSEYDSGIHKRDPGSSPQSATSALEEALLGDTNFDPILRSQLFTPLSSQQRSLKSEQSIVSEKNQQLEHEIPTPRPTQSTSALPLPSTTPESQKKPSVIERTKAIETLSAEKANAHKSVDHSKAASNWFTRKKPSHLSHVSDSEDER